MSQITIDGVVYEIEFVNSDLLYMNLSGGDDRLLVDAKQMLSYAHKDDMMETRNLGKYIEDELTGFAADNFEQATIIPNI